MDDKFYLYQQLNHKNLTDLVAFLYRDIGLFWEIILSKKTDLLSLPNNKELSRFLKKHGIMYNTTNAESIEKKLYNIEENSFYYTDTGPNVIGGLVKHLRNSIMHGQFQICEISGRDEIHFQDYYIKKQTMIGKIEISLLRKFVNALHNTAIR